MLSLKSHTLCNPEYHAGQARCSCAQSVAGSSPRSSSSEKDAAEGGALGRLSAAQRHQLAVLLDTAMLKVGDNGSLVYTAIVKFAMPLNP